jgi:hypothetical protein
LQSWLGSADMTQGCQMVYFETQNPSLGKLWRILLWYILWPFGQFSCHFEYFMDLWYIMWSFGIFSPFWCMYHEKSGNPDMTDAGSNR